MKTEKDNTKKARGTKKAESANKGETAKKSASVKVPKTSKKVQVLAHVSGKRKKAIARTTITPGNGRFVINSQPLDNYSNNIARIRIREVLNIVSEYANLGSMNIDVSVFGGGTMGQVDAVRTSLSRAFVQCAQGSAKGSLRAALVNYDRVLLAGDSRRTEPHKPSHSSQGPRAKRQKSYR